MTSGAHDLEPVGMIYGAAQTPRTGPAFPACLTETLDAPANLICHQDLGGRRDAAAAAVGVYPAARRGRAESFAPLNPRLVHDSDCIVSGMVLAGEIACGFAITMNTVRTHLERLLDRTGARNQTDLVRPLLRSPAPLSHAY